MFAMRFFWKTDGIFKEMGPDGARPRRASFVIVAAAGSPHNVRAGGVGD
jgi:hypothetical protein